MVSIFYTLWIFPLAQSTHVHTHSPLQYIWLIYVIFFRDSRAQFRICFNLLIWFSNVIYFSANVTHLHGLEHRRAIIACFELHFNLIWNCINVNSGEMWSLPFHMSSMCQNQLHVKIKCANLPLLNVYKASVRMAKHRCQYSTVASLICQYLLNP